MKMDIDKIPGLSQLFRDYVNNAPGSASFFNGPFQETSSYQSVAEKLDSVDRRRDELVAILTEQNRTYGAGEATFNNINLLSDPKTLAVVTGQQAGLFGGPLYTTHKALTTIKLARNLSEQLQRPVVPVFYLVSEDHDFDEIKSTGYIDKTNSHKTLNFQPDPFPERSPVAEISLNSSVTGLIDTLGNDLADSEFKAAILDKLNSAYRSGEKIHISFARWFQELFNGYGIILYDSADPRPKSMVTNIFERELTDNISNRALSDTNARLERAGYHTQITVHNDRPNLFILDHGRHSLRREDGSYINMSNNDRYSAGDLLKRPERLSPKVSLRPLVQDALFPTVAYVGGPGEIAYWAQLKGIYDALNMTMPVVHPRAAFTLIEPKVQRHLDSFSLNAAQVIADTPAAVKAVLQSRVPEDIQQRFRTLQETLGKQMEGLAKSAAVIDPTLLTVFDKATAGLIKQVESLENKVTRAVEQREQVTRRQLETITTHLMPDGLQERSINILTFLVKYDKALLQRLYDEIDLFTFEHKLIGL